MPLVQCFCTFIPMRDRISRWASHTVVRHSASNGARIGASREDEGRRRRVVVVTSSSSSASFSVPAFCFSEGFLVEEGGGMAMWLAEEGERDLCVVVMEEKGEEEVVGPSHTEGSPWYAHGANAGDTSSSSTASGFRRKTEGTIDTTPGSLSPPPLLLLLLMVVVVVGQPTRWKVAASSSFWDVSGGTLCCSLAFVSSSWMPRIPCRSHSCVRRW